MPFVTRARRAVVEQLTSAVIERALGLPGVSEGRVRGRNRAGYRRLDCEGRALAFVRGRPSAGGVRIDVSGLWVRPERSRLEMPKSEGPPSLLVQSPRDVEDAGVFLAATIRTTQAAYAEQAARRRRQEGGPFPRIAPKNVANRPSARG